LAIVGANMLVARCVGCPLLERTSKCETRPRYSSQDSLPAPPGLRAKPAFWLPPVPNRPHLAGCTADLPVFQPPCAAPILRAADNTAHVATHLERWGRQLLALPAR